MREVYRIDWKIGFFEACIYFFAYIYIYTKLKKIPFFQFCKAISGATVPKRAGAVLKIPKCFWGIKFGKIFGEMNFWGRKTGGQDDKKEL